MVKPRMATASTFDTEREGTGTREWSEHSCNIGTGCSHDCLYCYARQHAIRFGLISDAAEWPKEKVRPGLKTKRYGKKNGTIMFPTTHDISPYYLEASLGCLDALLNKGNQVLIVTKPHMECIKKICQELARYRDAMLFRFTITSTDSLLSSFWEPGAPTPAERLQSLSYAFSESFRTSVSMEPMLHGTDDAIATAGMVMPFITDTVWIGKMNKPLQRVDTSLPVNRDAVSRVAEMQSDKEILRLAKQLRHPKIRWKDSITAVLKRHQK